MKDIVVFAGLVVSFAVFVTAQIALVVELASRKPVSHALLAFLLAPLAIYWGWRERLFVRAVACGAAIAGYAVLRLLSGVGG